MSESEMVERVARAIAHLRMCEKQGNVVPCASCQNVRGYNDDVGCMTLALAAIAAIREPAEAMVDAGWNAQPMGPVCDWDMEGIWTEMIAAALSEPPPRTAELGTAEAGHP